MNLDEIYSAKKIFVFGDIDEDKIKEITEALFELDSTNTDPITVYIYSQGGHSRGSTALARLFTMSRCEITTVVLGQAMSGAVLIAAAGKKGRRYAIKGSRFFIHRAQYSAEEMISADVLVSEADTVRRADDIYAKLLEELTNIKQEDFYKLSVTNNYGKDIYTEEAIKFGIIDHEI